MATKIKRNSKGTAKGLAISAGAGVAGGATTGFVAKTLFGKHTNPRSANHLGQPERRLDV